MFTLLIVYLYASITPIQIDNFSSKQACEIAARQIVSRLELAGDRLERDGKEAPIGLIEICVQK